MAGRWPRLSCRQIPARSPSRQPSGSRAGRAWVPRVRGCDAPADQRPVLLPGRVLQEPQPGRGSVQPSALQEAERGFRVAVIEALTRAAHSTATRFDHRAAADAGAPGRRLGDAGVPGCQRSDLLHPGVRAARQRHAADRRRADALRSRLARMRNVIVFETAAGEDRRNLKKDLVQKAGPPGCLPSRAPRAMNCSRNTLT